MDDLIGEVRFIDARRNLCMQQTLNMYHNLLYINFDVVVVEYRSDHKVNRRFIVPLVLVGSAGNLPAVP